MLRFRFLAALSWLSIIALPALAEQSGSDAGGQRPSSNRVAPLAPVGGTFGAVQKVYVRSDSIQVSTASQTFVTLGGAIADDTTTTVSAYLITFSGTCAVNGQNLEEDVRGRILFNGTEIAPGDTTLCEDFAEAGKIPESSVAQRWYVKNVPAGTNAIRFQWRVDAANTTGILRDWVLTIERHANN